MNRLSLFIAISFLAVRSLAADVVFVRTDTAGVFHPEEGRLTQVTPQFVILQTSAGDRLYTRDAVREIVLDARTSGDRERWARLISRYWNSDAPALVKVVQSLPLLGEPLKALSQIPPTVASALATIALCAGFIWLLLKAYEITIVENETRGLDHLRLKLEIAKLRSELIELVRKRDVKESNLWEMVEIPIPDLRPTVLEEDGISPYTAPWYLRPFMNTEARAEQRTLYAAEAMVRKQRGTRSMRRARIGRELLFIAGALFCFFYGALVVIGAVGLLFTASGAGGEFVGALVLIALGLLLMRQSIRLVLKAQDLRAAYGHAMAQSPAAQTPS